MEQKSKIPRLPLRKPVPAASAVASRGVRSGPANGQQQMTQPILQEKVNGVGINRNKQSLAYHSISRVQQPKVSKVLHEMSQHAKGKKDEPDKCAVKEKAFELPPEKPVVKDKAVEVQPEQSNSKEKDFQVQHLPKPSGLTFVPEKSRTEHVKYFRGLVAAEKHYETTMADQWEKALQLYGPDSQINSISEEGVDLIRLAVGQSRLFMNKKMQQFVGLIDECEQEQERKLHGEKDTSPTDLAGFWEMIYMQVENIHRQFDLLETMSANNWKAPTPVISKSMVDGAKASGARKVAHNPGKTRPTQASAGIREAMEKARAAKAAQISAAGDSKDVLEV